MGIWWKAFKSEDDEAQDFRRVSNDESSSKAKIDKWNFV